MKNISVYGNLVDRYLFNFRADPVALEKHLPNVDWLKPRTINGYGVVSFCLLKLKGLTMWPLPSSLGLDTTSCAYRCAVIDESGKKPEPSVYVLGRNTDLSIISRLGPKLFSGNIEKIDASVERVLENVQINAKYSDGKDMFSATVDSLKCKNDSKLFESEESFEDFIKDGISSYTPSTKENMYSRVDLETDSNQYEQVSAKINVNCLDDEWEDAKLVFDSAYRAGGNQYKLRYLGSVPSCV
ncbi:hypothetical protein [Nitrosopumilus sp.]|uniref:hypothetical protein n=1 Tax=Nitrosopumilus sp. TaxID=2024843 RepID=UPI003B5CDA74